MGHNMVFILREVAETSLQTVHVFFLLNSFWFIIAKKIETKEIIWNESSLYILHSSLSKTIVGPIE